jgi:hypothetical protein
MTTGRINQVTTVHPVAHRPAAAGSRRPPLAGGRRSSDDAGARGPRARPSPHGGADRATGTGPCQFLPLMFPHGRSATGPAGGCPSTAHRRGHAPVTRGLSARSTPTRAADHADVSPNGSVAAVVNDQPSTDPTIAGGQRPRGLRLPGRSTPRRGPPVAGRHPLPQPRPRRNRGAEAR